MEPFQVKIKPKNENQSIINLSKIEYSSVRCERCIKNHRKCSRTFPKCTLCHQYNKQCQYLKIARRQRRLQGFEQHLIQFKKQSKHESPLSFQPGTSNSTFRTWKLNSFQWAQQQIKLNLKDFNLKYGLVAFMLKVDAHNFFSNVIGRLLFPTQNRKGMDLILRARGKAVLEKVERWSTSIGLENNKLKAYFNEKKTEIKLLLNEALKLYFQKNNSSLPIFIEEKFQLNERKPLVRLAILASGLVWVSPSPLQSYLLYLFSKKLEICFKNIINLKPKFETLQALLTLAVGLSNFKWVNFKYNQIVAYCYRACYSLGLHLSYKKCSSILEKERALVYGRILLLGSGITISNGASLASPCKPKILDTQYNKLLIACQYNRTNQESITRESASDCLNMLFRSYSIDLASILFLIHFLKCQILSTSKLKSHQLISLSLTKLNQYKQHYLSIYTLIESHSNLPVDSERLQTLKYHCEFYDHYLRFIIQLFQLNNTTSTESVQTQLIKDMVYHCSEALNYLINLPSHFFMHKLLTCLTQCLIFVLRNSNFTESIQQIMIKTIHFLKELKKEPFINIDAYITLIKLTIEDVRSKGHTDEFHLHILLSKLEETEE